VTQLLEEVEALIGKPQDDGNPDAPEPWCAGCAKLAKRCVADWVKSWR